MLVCLGSICADILTQPVGEIHWNATAWIDRLDLGLGGNGASSSYTAAMHGAAVRLIGAVGQDSFGDFVLGQLRAAGVDVEAVARTDQPTSATTVLVGPDGARALLHRPGASRSVTPGHVRFLPTDSHFHLANVFGLPQLRPAAADLLRRAHAAGLSTSMDTGWDARGEWIAVIGPALPHTGYLFVNEDEARILSAHGDARAAAAFFRQQGVGHVIVKLGAQGCFIAAPGVELHCPAYQVTAIDTTGAGDCFAGAFLAAIARGCTLAEAARMANAAGALNVQSLGGVTGIRSRIETEAWMATAATSPAGYSGSPDSSSGRAPAG